MGLNGTKFWLLGSIVIAPIFSGPAVQAQIIPDATLPQNSSVPANCLHCRIDGGTIRGNNLFHSFREFSVITGGSAWFNNAATIQTILTRVTGNNRSVIDGLLKTNGTANLFFLNPNGILFGPNARLDIGGSFHASTAHSFQFPDGSEFSATQPQAPPLLTINLTPGLQYGAVPAGSTITNQGQLSAGQDLMLQGDRIMVQGTLQAGRDLTLRATDTVQVRDTTTTPFLAQANRHLTVQGDRGIDILALNHPTQTPFVSGGNLRLISDGVISADAHFASGDRFQVVSLTGQPAILTSLYDPIISSAGDVEILGDYNGPALLVETLGNVLVQGNITIAGPDVAFTGNPDPDLAILGSSPALIIRSGKQFLAHAPSALPTLLDGATFQAGSALPPGITITGEVFTGNSPTVGGPIILEAAQGNITTGILNAIAPNGGRISLTAPRGNITTGEVSTIGYDPNSSGGNVRMQTTTGNITTGPITTLAPTGGAISLSTETGNITTGDITTLGYAGNAGNVQLTAQRGNITVPVVVALGVDGKGGNVQFETQDGNISIADEVNAGSVGGVPANGGNVRLATANGNVVVGNSLNSFSFSGGNAGTIEIVAGDRADSPTVGNIVTHVLNATASNGNGGTISLTTTNGDIRPTDNILANSDNGNAGNITLSTTKGDIVMPQDTTLQARACLEFVSGCSGNGGDIFVFTGNGNVSLEQVFSYAEGNGGRITVLAPQGQNTSKLLLSHSYAAGTGGDIRVEAGAPGLLNTSGIFSLSRTGHGGNIDLAAIGDVRFISVNSIGNTGSGNITITSGNTVAPGLSDETGTGGLTSDTFGPGKGGDIIVTARRVYLGNGAQVTASTHSSGAAGAITIQASDSVEIMGINPVDIKPGVFQPSGFAGIPDGTYLGGYIPSGNLANLTVAERRLFPSGIFSQSTVDASGAAGTIRIETAQLLLQAGGTIATTTFGQGNGGAIALQTNATQVDGGAILSGAAPGAIGSSGGIDIQTRTLALTNQGFIQSQTLGRGTAGAIQVNATEAVTLTGAGSAIRSGSGDRQNSVPTIGAGGNLRITAPTVQLADSAQLSAETYTASQGGSIFVSAHEFEAQRGAQIRTTAFNTGQAGNINLALTGPLTLTDATTGFFADTAVDSSGFGGSIFVTAGQIHINHSATISVNSKGSGQGGSIDIRTRTLNLSDRGSITAETASAQGGDITLTLQDFLVMRRNSLISATAGTAQAGGDGGNITITAPFLISVLSEDNDIRANAFTGRGGQITINALGIFGLRFQPSNTPLSDITASSQFGVSGVVTLNTLNLDPNQGLVNLPVNFADASNRIQQTCSATGNAGASGRFVITGIGGLPTTPTDMLSGDRALVMPIEAIGHARTGSRLSHQEATTPAPMAAPAPIMEAQGWEMTADGGIQLVTQGTPPRIHSIWAPAVPCPEP